MTTKEEELKQSLLKLIGDKRTPIPTEENYDPEPVITESLVSVIIPACNEEDLAPTVKSLLDGETDYPYKLEIVVVSNGQPAPPTDLPDDPRVKVVFDPEQLGVGGGRNVGVANANGAVFIIVDGHMRFDAGAVRRLAGKSEQMQAWMCGEVRGRHADGKRGATAVNGAAVRYHWNGYMGYRYEKTQTIVQQVALITGAFFAVPRSIYEVWGEWDNTNGLWGYSEEGQSIKNFFLDRKMFCYKAAVADHLYRGKNPYPISESDRWLNFAQTHRIYFSDATFKNYWLPILFRNIKAPHLVDKLHAMIEDEGMVEKNLRFQADKKKTDVDFFKDFLGVHVKANGPNEVVDVPRVSIIVPSCNEGAELRTTVESILSSAKCEPEIIVVDDKSTDDSVDNLIKYRKKLHRRYKPYLQIYSSPMRMGCDRCRNFGVKRSTGDIVLFGDAHTRWPEGAVETLAQAAIDKDAIICSSFQNFTESEDRVSSTTYGAHFTNRKGRAVGNAYNKKRPEEALSPIHAIIGSVYAIPKTLFEELGGWYEVPDALWGYSEQALAWKVYFWQVGAMYCARDVVIKHRLRKDSKFPYDISNRRNVCPQAYFVHRVCFEDETFNTLWKPTLTEFFGPPPASLWETTEYKEAKAEFEQRRVKTDADFFREVMPNAEVK